MADRVSALLRAVRLRSGSVPDDVLRAFVELGEAAVPPLVAALRDGTVASRRAAAATLGYLRFRAAVPALNEALGDADSGVAEYAARSLGWLGDASAVPGLIQALHHPNRDVRVNAAVALRDLDAREAADALRAAAEEDDDFVRHAARKTLWKFAERAAEES